MSQIQWDSERVRKFSGAPKSLRQMMYNDKSEDSRLCAAIELQRFLRGYLVRKHGAEFYVDWRDNILNRRGSLRVGNSADTERLHNTPHSQPQTVNINNQTRDLNARRDGSPLTSHQAAIKIQRFWRKHIDIQVYKYYRDLINFKNEGDPALMLKCVNPKESSLFDAASGIHVKFRLAGERFPPNIYYKVFTHRPIQDLCAYAPRDYTTSAKQKDMRAKHNRNFYTEEQDAKDNWYKRIENNGWRLVSDRLIKHILNDPVTWTTTNKKIDYHHDKLKRQQDVKRAKKQKKIDWMRKMYRDGLIRARADDPETIALVEGAAHGMVATVDAEGLDAVAEWEVDELLDWTTSLNFDDYASSWKQVGTSATTEDSIMKRFGMKADNYDDFTINITASAHNSFGDVQMAET